MTFHSFHLSDDPPLRFYEVYFLNCSSRDLRESCRLLFLLSYVVQIYMKLFTRQNVLLISYVLILILLIVCFFFYCSLMFCVRCRESHLLRRDSPQHHITCNSLLCLICLHRDRVNTICWILTTIHYLEVHFLQILITI